MRTLLTCSDANQLLTLINETLTNLGAKIA